MNQFLKSLFVSLFVLGAYLVYHKTDTTGYIQRDKLNTYIGIVSICFGISYYGLFQETSPSMKLEIPVNHPKPPF